MKVLTVQSQADIADIRRTLLGRTLVLTNGCYDILHPGHISTFEFAKRQGDYLLVAVNTDESVRKLKGPNRPIVPEDQRAAVISALRSVDAVCLFSDIMALVRLVRPDIHVKGGDYVASRLPEADLVAEYGGRVVIAPLVPDNSSSSLIQRARGDHLTVPAEQDPVCRTVCESRELLSAASRDTVLRAAICASGKALVQCLKAGNKVLACGNGGSAATAHHFVAELVGRFERERQGLPAVALGSNVATLSAIGNDYGFERTFEREVHASGVPADVLVAISTSGRSANVRRALSAAREIGLLTIGLTGSAAEAGAREFAGLCTHTCNVPSPRTARIQEMHMLIQHVWCGMIDDAFGGVQS